jgi:hypothetical protein
MPVQRPPFSPKGLIIATFGPDFGFKHGTLIDTQIGGGFSPPVQSWFY